LVKDGIFRRRKPCVDGEYQRRRRGEQQKKQQQQYLCDLRGNRVIKIYVE